MCVAVPHDLVAWGRISGTADVAAEASYDTDGIAEVDGFCDRFFLA